jgi:hypothetical protein
LEIVNADVEDLLGAVSWIEFLVAYSVLNCLFV